MVLKINMTEEWIELRISFAELGRKCHTFIQSDGKLNSALLDTLGAKVAL